MKKLLKFLTCGSVDDGKSTLLGHLLYKGKMIYADQERKLQLDSHLRSNLNDLDYSLLLDGLQDEREQGITIDVAYRYFHSEKRSFIVADTPGHEEYTRNMAVGASFADLSVILVDCRKGVLSQTKRHLEICSFMGIEHFIFALNKMDLCQYDESIFQEISLELHKIMDKISHNSLKIIPVSAKMGDNLSELSPNMTWYQGESLLSYLESISISETMKKDTFVFPVQRVCRPDLDFRGFQGEIAQGSVKTGDKIVIYPTLQETTIKQIFCGDKHLMKAYQGMPVTLQLEDEVDCSRGSVITCGKNLENTDSFTCKMLWMDDISVEIGQSYLMKLATSTIPVHITQIHGEAETDSSKENSQIIVKKNQIFSCDISTGPFITCGTFDECPTLSRFILIDRMSKNTVSCGIITRIFQKNSNLCLFSTAIHREIRENQKNQKAQTLWFTGLSASGKSTLANAVEKHLVSEGKHTMLLDGDNIRMGLCRDLGFSPSERQENIRRIAETAKLMNDAGLVVLVAAISPYENDRQMARDIVGEGFIEIFVSTPLEECEKRDIKQLYSKARAGEILDFTGISSPYEKPVSPDIIVNTLECTIQNSVENIVQQLK